MENGEPHSEEQEIESCGDDITPTGSLTNLLITVDTTEEEDDLANMGMNLYKLRETQMRCKLHEEYLDKYVTENIIPIGLQVPIKLTVDDDNDHTRDFKKRFEEKNRNNSKELAAHVVDFIKDRVH